MARWPRDPRFILTWIVVAQASGCTSRLGYVPTPEGAPPPPAVSLLAPPDNSATPRVDVAFSWSPYDGASTYTISLSTEPRCQADLFRADALVDTTYALAAPGPLTMGGVYYWCVRAFDDAGLELGRSEIWRLQVAPYRTRWLAPTPRPMPSAAQPGVVLGLAGGEELVDVTLGGWRVIRDLFWRFDAGSGRWQPEPAAQAAPVFSGYVVRASVVDEAAGEVLVLASSFDALYDDEIPDALTLWRLSVATASWTELPLEAADAAGLLACDDELVVADPTRQRFLVFGTACEGDQPIVAVLTHDDVGGTLALLATTGALRGTAGQSAAAIDPASDLLLLSGASPYGEHVVDLLDLATATWRSAESPTGTLPSMGYVAALDAVVAVTEAPPHLFVWDRQTETWPVLPATNDAFADLVLAPVPGQALFGRLDGSLLVPMGDQSTGVPAGPATGGILVVEPADRPVLTLADLATGSADGTEADGVAVTCTGDEGAVGWLLTEDGSAPAASDVGWQSVRPTSYTFAAAVDGLKVVRLWLRYPHGSVGRFPGVASIWRLTSAPAAPTFVVYDGSFHPGVTPVANRTGSGSVTALLTSSWAGLAGFVLRESADPVPEAEAFTAYQMPLPMGSVAPPPRLVVVHGWVIDAAGHVSPAGAVEVDYRDTVPPNVQLDRNNTNVFVSGAAATLTVTVSDDTPPVILDWRVSSSAGCAGDLLSLDGQSSRDLSLPTASFVPGHVYYACVRGTDGATPPNVGTFRETTLFYQATPARWFALAPSPDNTIDVMALAYDRTRQRLLTFGGFHGGNFHSRVQAYDPVTNTWSATFTTTGPAPSDRAMAVGFVDTASDRLIVFGGYYWIVTSTLQELNDTYALDLSTLVWSKLTPSNPPPGRHASAFYFDPGSRKFWVSQGTAGNSPAIYDVASNAWTIVPRVTGMPWSYGPACDSEEPGVPTFVDGMAMYTYDLTTATATKTGDIVSGYTWPTASAWDDNLRGVVWYSDISDPLPATTRRTYVILEEEPGVWRQFLTDAGNLADRHGESMAREEYRRSAVLLGGNLIHQNSGPPGSNTFVEFRKNGGPRVFASDPTTHSEKVVTGATVDLAVDWDETATAWLTNEAEWPAPAPTAADWSGTRPTSYAFPDGGLGERTIYVWIKDAGGTVVLDAGRWSVTRQ